MTSAMGSSKILETGYQTESELWSKEESGLSVERRVMMPHALALQALRSASIGATYSEAFPSLVLKRAAISSHEGPLVVLAYVYESPDPEGGEGTKPEDPEEDEALQETWALSWQDITKPLQQAPALVEQLSQLEYNAKNGQQGTYYDCIERIKEADSTHQHAYQWRDPTKDDLPDSDSDKWTTFSDEVPEAVKKYFEKWWAGIDSFQDCYPIVTHTKVFLEAPALPSGAGTIVACPWSSAPTGYEWRYKPSLSCDVTTGRWTLQEEYTGALKWDKDLYTHQKVEN